MKCLFIAFNLLLTNIAQAEPWPWGIMVKGSQCAKYWAGDECVMYRIPEGWTPLYGQTLKHRGKVCKFSVGNESICCKKLGLKFIELKLEKNLNVSMPHFCKK